MAISTSSEQGILALIFNSTTWTGWAMNTTASPNAAVAVSLQTADPLTAGNMGTSEATYTGYLRISLSRAGTTAWAAPTGGNPASVSPVANIGFGPCTGGTNTITNFATGGATPTTAPILWSGTVTPTITVASGTTPSLTNATTITLL